MYEQRKTDCLIDFRCSTHACALIKIYISTTSPQRGWWGRKKSVRACIFVLVLVVRRRDSRIRCTVCLFGIRSRATTYCGLTLKTICSSWFRIRIILISIKICIYILIFFVWHKQGKHDLSRNQYNCYELIEAFNSERKLRRWILQWERNVSRRTDIFKTINIYSLILLFFC